MAMSDDTKEPTAGDLLKNSTLYREFQAEREEILKISDDLSPIGGEFIQGKTHDGILLLNADRLVEDPRWVIRENAGLFQ